MSRFDPTIAVNRFGLGANSADRRAAGGDPRGWLVHQLEQASPQAVFAGLPSGTEAVMLTVPPFRAGPAMPDEATRATIRDLYAREVTARIAAQVQGDQPFRERLVMFWSNLFTVSIQRPVLIGVVGAFEREAIRARLDGRFADMLIAVARHQTMLLYLDQAASIGPNSPVGRRRGRGLNENLAREILELHTLGVDGGYVQNDVRALAAILTGWTIARPDSPERGAFRFVAAVHEPGTHRLLGRDYPDRGLDQGVSALTDLARHPATVRRLCHRLARHMVADTPPAALVARLEAAWRDSDGHLPTVHRALVEAPEAWSPEAAKVKTPVEFVLSVWRLLGMRGGPGPRIAAFRDLGQPVFGAPSPEGWSDRARDWLAPEMLMRRIEWAHAQAARVGDAMPAREAAMTALADGVSADLALAIDRAPSAADALTILVTSPEFMRR
jgi:uncharacterized protein (DUF1800 family)